LFIYIIYFVGYSSFISSNQLSPSDTSTVYGQLSEEMMDGVHGQSRTRSLLNDEHKNKTVFMLYI